MKCGETNPGLCGFLEAQISSSLLVSKFSEYIVSDKWTALCIVDASEFRKHLTVSSQWSNIRRKKGGKIQGCRQATFFANIEVFELEILCSEKLWNCSQHHSWECPCMCEVKPLKKGRSGWTGAKHQPSWCRMSSADYYSHL